MTCFKRNGETKLLQGKFASSVYEDAPDLSDQILLPNLALGHNLFLVCAFVPSYIVRLVRDLAESPEIEPGHLSLTFYVPGNLIREDQAIVRLRTYIEQGIGAKAESAEFVDDCLQLVAEGGLSLQVVHGPQKTAISKGAFGVFTDPETEDFVGIEDSKGGDYNSPVVPRRSWITDQYTDAERILERTNKVLAASKAGVFLANHEVAARWLSRIALWYGETPEYFSQESPTPTAAATTTGAEHDSPVATLSGDEISTDFDVDFMEYLKNESLAEVGWDTDADFDLEDVSEFFAADYAVEVEPWEITEHHVPPLPEILVGLLGHASATCPCGKRILRANGCEAIVW